MSRFSDFGNQLYSGQRSIDFVGRRKFFYVIALAMLALAILIPMTRGGFNFGIEFKGGSEYRISASKVDSTLIAEKAVHKIVDNIQVNTTRIGADTIRVQTPQLSDTQSEKVRLALAKAYKVVDSNVASSFIGPNWGADITSKAISGLLTFIVLAAILMALYFRTLKMSVAAMLALAHDLVITAGIYGALGFEVTPAAVIGFLTILGYSLYDTVVVFDKIRENTNEVEFSETATFKERVNLAINQTLVRSINTSVVAVLPVAAILFIGAYVLGAGTLRDISLALFIGILVGTYSTIFIAAPFYSQLREGETKYVKAAAKVFAKRA
ncbi:MAG: protein translocase subunit SecF [Micrococcales bacterium]|jgi:preprotein translocase subunit SecF|nr:protein translocase subunit SecF [Actinomycetota bacterium]NCA07181.1 protein translocase subunit SecF [Micrococcales bacterium]